MITLQTPPRYLALLATLLAISACAHGGRTSYGSAFVVDASEDNMAGPAKSSRETISRAEINGARVRTAYDAVKRLRPGYLRGVSSRRPAGPTVGPVVYIDNVVGGGLEALSDVPVDMIDHIRYVTPGDAVGRYGPIYGGGLIIVRLRR